MGESQICDISDEVKEELRKFRFRKSTNNSAMILKVDREKQKVILDEFLDDISVEELQEQLPGHQPRFVIYTYKMKHDDDRISYPMCFIFYTPRDSQIELQMMYACTKTTLQREIDLTRVYEIRELDELTEEWLREKLGK
ncbi:glia maturation factor beta [Condylostylus longicornis]|uniref:glia maturation factor beta n=1 Tax=Condylostylus longicornis TaxID=2530218 RepID=UPI00244E2D44|nr:glia maturation factor beta [Condylostylus longicornis]